MERPILHTLLLRLAGLDIDSLLHEEPDQPGGQPSGTGGDPGGVPLKQSASSARSVELAVLAVGASS